MKVTALRLQSRNKTRVNVYLDGQYAFSLIKIEAVRLRLGQVLTDADIARLKDADEREMAYERALKLLVSRPRSEAEVRQRLREHAVPEPTITLVLERLRQSGLADDQAFANFWVENRNTFRPRSKRALQMELKRKGVTGETAQQALAATNDEEAAYRLAVQQARKLSALPFPDFRRKLNDFLLRRGFGYDTVGPIIKRVWEETHTTPAETEDDF